MRFAAVIVVAVTRLRLARLEPRERQDSSTADMIVGVAEIVAYLSQFFTSHPGDVMSTGTPQGVGLGMKPPKYLEAGQVIKLGIDGLGEQRQRAIHDPTQPGLEWQETP